MTILTASEAVLAQARSTICADCHPAQAAKIAGSVHQEVVPCQDCHGGPGAYELTPEQRQTFLPDAVTTSRPGGFEHGGSFRGRISRTDILETCGTCHSDIERMNPYGLRTDQLRAYWLSGHGKRLKLYGDDRVAVCIDCHGSHDVLSKADAHSRTHFSHIPDTCGRCHADRSLMDEYNRPSDIVDQYRSSIHGRNVLEKGDAGSPQCATCHGSHAAAPPGFSQVGHVCGQCHKQVEEYVLSSVHGRISVLARCTGCHGQGGNPRNHQIEAATPPPEALVQTYVRLRDESGLAPENLPPRFIESLDTMPGSLRPDAVCRFCHGPGRSGAHAAFFTTSDQTVLDRGTELSMNLRKAQLEYAQTADRVARTAEGVLLVRDEAVRAEDAKTEIMALYAFMHTFNLPEIQKRAENLNSICREINDRLDQKESGLHWRHWATAPIWAFAALFFFLMYGKYRELRRIYVRAVPEGASPTTAEPSADRRRFLDTALRLLGGAAVAALLYPAVVYILPARKRGGSDERVGAGKEEGWGLWEARKIVVAGKPVAVIRTDQCFRAVSLVCTHLGCIVHWEPAGREFLCPCHAARFGAAGEVIAGPPPRALPQFGVSVIQGEVVVIGAQQG